MKQLKPEWSKEIKEYYETHYNPHDISQPTANHWGFVLLTENNVLREAKNEWKKQYLLKLEKLKIAVTALRAITSSEYCTEFGDEPCELAETALKKILGVKHET